ncbi:MAG: hypothetical protein H0U27_02425 [Nitrosopumilus sp.]|nr:hypothetical protein [Nitrosopumilus sp.]
MKNIVLKYRQKKWANIFVIYLRYLIGGAFVFSSIPKIAGQRFTTNNCETTPIDTWMHFFETLYRSGIYWDFLGWVQLLAGLILMTQIYSTLGALIFLPIILNVLIITISYKMTGTIVISGLMFLANIYLVFWDNHKTSVLLMPERKTETSIASYYNEFYNNVFWAWLGFLIFVTTIFYVILYDRNPMLWFLICVLEGLAGLIYLNIKAKRGRILN